MPVTSVPNRMAPTDKTTLRRFLSRAETITLLGMVVTVCSLFLAWERYAFKPAAFPVPAMVVNLTERTTIGFGLAVWRPMTLCAVLCGILLMWTPNAKNRLPLAIIQGICGVTCVVSALTHLSLLPGVIVGLLGGILLTFGAVDRFTQTQKG